MRPEALPARSEVEWAWPINLAVYDQSPALTQDELDALTRLSPRLWHWRWRREPEWQLVDRLVRPLLEARAAVHVASVRQVRPADDAVTALLRAMFERQTTIWAWCTRTWIDVFGHSRQAFSSAHRLNDDGFARQPMIAIAYLLRCFPDPRPLRHISRVVLAEKVFGRGHVAAAVDPVERVLAAWGYVENRTGTSVRRVLCTALLLNGSPRLTDLRADVLEECWRGLPHRGPWRQIERALDALGVMDLPPPRRRGRGTVLDTRVDPRWAEWVRRWEATSTVRASTRRGTRGVLMRIGRWLAAEHPEVYEPGQWTRQLCATAVAAIDRMQIGQYAVRPDVLGDRVGQPFSARAKSSYLSALRVFFDDCTEWGWIPRRFDPGRAFATPRSVLGQLTRDPRVIADDVWAKLLWAGLNLTQDDLARGNPYPLELVRALAVTWLFSGLRSNEIVRLRLGCVRWQSHPETEVDDTTRICILDVPPHKTGGAFSKPVDAIVGEAIDAWELARPVQPDLLDRFTGEHVAFLFCYRAMNVDNRYLNRGLIPALCRKAGVPARDARGTITSHRARSTIATHLFNAKEPMSLFELQAWLGHRNVSSTQSYALITPTTLARAYSDAGYFTRNLRTIEVLIDRDAVLSGAAAAGQPWQFFDLGHGHCTYTFFEQCPHRMACARCDFYVPKASTRSQLLEGKANLGRMLIEIPLTEAERAAVEDGHSATQRLLDRLCDVPTPAGCTPRGLREEETASSAPRRRR
ncbi:MAG: tyrosine-type recombinase/integrase [Pseudonocardiaceae bacterium]